MSVRSFRTSSIRTGEKRSKFWDQSAVVLNPAFESIASATPNGVGTVTFNSIPQTYSSLQLRISGVFGTSGNSVNIRPNSDTGSNFVRHRFYGDGSTVTANGATSLDRAAVFGAAVGVSTTQPAVIIVDIHNYNSTTQNKTIRSFSGIDLNGSGEVNLFSSLWMQTTAISSLEVLSASNFATGTTIALYGIKSGA